MEILHKGSLHTGHKVKMQCPYCGTIVKIIQGEPDTDIEVFVGCNGQWTVGHVFYTCPECDTRVISNKYDRATQERLLLMELEPNVKLTQDEVNLLYHPELLDDETKIIVS